MKKRIYLFVSIISLVCFCGLAALAAFKGIKKLNLMQHYIQEITALLKNKPQMPTTTILPPPRT